MPTRHQSEDPPPKRKKIERHLQIVIQPLTMSRNTLYDNLCMVLKYMPTRHQPPPLSEQKKINVTSNVCIREHELNQQSAKGQSPYAFERYSIALHFLDSKFWFGLERICPGIFKLLLKQFPQNQSSYDEWTDISKTYFRKKNCPWGTVLLVT